MPGCIKQTKFYLPFEERKLIALLIAATLLCFKSWSQPVRILHYTETSGFDHLTRDESFTMFQQLAAQHNFTVDNDSTGQFFSSLPGLMDYDVVVFSNTSGDQILDSVQRQNFESYINAGGALIGIHAASDTYRHSTANGFNTGSWDWYAETLGASVQQNPNHVAGTPVYRIDVLQSHPLLSGIPDPWYKPEEYYYWEAGYINSSNAVLQKVQQTTGPNGQVNSYDSSRAVTWYRILPGGGKVFYTSLGHEASNFTSDTSFILLMENALLWATDSTTGLAEWNDVKVEIFPNPFDEYVLLKMPRASGETEFTLRNARGGKIVSRKFTGETQLNTSTFSGGVYILELSIGGKKFVYRLLKTR